MWEDGEECVCGRMVSSVSVWGMVSSVSVWGMVRSVREDGE